jgi:transcriptional regulator GlxA family with amidase domain
MLAGNAVESVVGRARFQRHVVPGDERGLPFQRLHDAVRECADGIALEVAVLEAIGALGTTRPLDSDQPTRAVRRARALLHERLSESVSLDLLAEHADSDKFHLCREFRAQIGMSPHAYQTRVRIWRAKELLSVGVKPVEVAALVGFYDQSQLNKHFRRIVGTTPARYARGH